MSRNNDHLTDDPLEYRRGMGGDFTKDAPRAMQAAPAVKPNGHKPSPQQQAVITWAKWPKHNVFVEAVAGAGKTTTLLAACKAMTPPKGWRYWSVAFVAFNKKIADEIKGKVELMKQAEELKRQAGEPFVDYSYIKVGTFHSYAFSAWRKANPDVELLSDRVFNERMIEAVMIPEAIQGLTLKLTWLAMQGAVTKLWQVTERDRWHQIVEHHDLLESLVDPNDLDKAIDKAIQCVAWCREVGPKWINFNTMLWLPTVTDVKVWTHNRVLTDEAQDTNDCRRLFVRKMLNEKFGAAAFVGDRHQAIYGFTGADNDSIDRIIADFQCKSMPLTVSYRCPKSVITEAQRYVSHIQAHETAPEGSVRDMNKDQWKTLVQGKQLRPTDAILCRNTSPLVSLCFNLLRNEVACFVEGKDIGEGLLVLLSRFKTKNIHTLREQLGVYRDKQIAKLIAKKKEMQAEQLADRVETLLVLADGCPDVACVVAKIKRIFADRLNPDGTENDAVRNAVCLSTIHKSKGREWPRVFILGMERYMPSKYAKQPWQQDQELNLFYVAITRSQGELVYLEALEDRRR